MKHAYSIALTAVLALSACGQDGEPRQIKTTGTARVERQAEVFIVGFDIAERRDDKLQSIEAASKKLNDLRAELDRMEGLKGHSIRLIHAETKSGEPERCFEPYDETFYAGNCTPVEFVTTLHMYVQGEPAEAAGDTLTLLNRLGAEDVSLGGFDVKDRTAAELEVRGLALADAVETARALAEQANARISHPLQVTYGEDLDDAEFELGTIGGDDTIVVTGSLIPAVPLTLPIGTVKFDAEVTATFALREKTTNNGN